MVTASLTVWHPAVFGTRWIKLEVIGDNDTLQPD
ncbi:MAG: thiazole synthase, partial [Pseudomonadota bacterium]